MIDWLFNNTPFYLMTQSFWRDEAFSYLMARMPILQMLYTTARDFNPPLYYGILHFWMNIFGSSEVAIRSLSLIFFAISVLYFLLFLVDILKVPEKRAHIYVFLYALNPFLLYYGIEARMYSLFALLTLCAFYYLLKKEWKWYAVFTTLALYTHYFFLFALVTQIIYMVLYEREELKKKFKYFIAPIIIFIPWIYYALPTLLHKTNEFWITALSPFQAINTIGVLFTGYEPIWVFYDKYIIFVSIMLLIILGYFLTRKLHHDKHLSMLLLWAFGAYFTIAIISFVKPLFVPRYLIFSAVGFNLLLAYMMEHVPQRTKIIIGVILFTMLIHYSYNESLFKRKGNIRKTLHEISTLAGPNDVVYVTNPGAYFTASYYIRDRKVFIYQSPESVPYFVGLALIPSSSIIQLLPSYPVKAFVLKDDFQYEIVSSQ
ncbi:hypothetical protein A3D80_02020 [Candidatus Roizmanbacteria bacterium RIFCSPHIGHO2_02_FULL_40_13b]|uniref:Glycosyltransferase RgtA/B/C/D-like domain-containing protein n=1 Tax=Candidatus Roizmanbacteria bacterium RIFCSPHIGHO2_01_FULL_39_24 TaxID=1802032 RepID=A0A1F7GL36_9BACT|nr:MAG: hypothetical protein A2799_01380 [Candidatus Roizmanbacteria bacterium RIFCSPHIGHO2_01_FULL_39_24]OGK26903.1 MAG: hypothetical protein A3D80_02020 [Candidatus Roizmanbacteria bacterium RIFCSPHIGHO2_02_FULL_40_13b]OGK49464.1 MAG: hypothetical protein A3A56_03615 [Candidatus Roizmanbacteria bacterium RIFCSPLOWO2_01_FULL_40_32]